jgi:hypothetical protein
MQAHTPRLRPGWTTWAVMAATLLLIVVLVAFVLILPG